MGTILTPVAHDDDPRHDVAGSVQVCDTAPETRSRGNTSDVADSYGRAVFGRSDDAVGEVGGALRVAQASDHILRPAELDEARPGLDIRATNRFDNFVDTEPEALQFLRVPVDLI